MNMQPHCRKLHLPLHGGVTPKSRAATRPPLASSSTPLHTMPRLHTPLLILIFLSMTTASPPSSASPADTLTTGAALGAGEKLVSRNGKFALGFFQPSGISKSGTHVASPNWYLGIWFHTIPVLTAVWIANRDEPIHANELNRTRLRISGDGDLIVVVKLAGGTESVIWSTHIASRTGRSRTSMNTTTATSAVLLDTGSLAVVGSPSSRNVPLWQSFDQPTDIMLPGAKIGWNKLTGWQTQYISRKNLIDPGLGSYCSALEPTGALVHKGRSWPSDVYWSWGAVRSSTRNLIPLLDSLTDMNPDTRGLISFGYNDTAEEEYYTYNLLNKSCSLFFVHEAFGGQVKLKLWSQDHQSWRTLYTHPVSPCTAYATCGAFTVCNGGSYPACECMESFSKKSPSDWDLDDTTGGCVRDNPLDCSGDNNRTGNSTDIFHPIVLVTLPYNPQIIEEATTQSQCAEACLSSCSCTAYSYRNSVCSVWHGDLLHVKRNDGIENTSEDVLYLRIAAKDSPNLRSKSNRKHITRVGTAAILVSSGLLMIMLLSMIIWRKKLKWFGSTVHGTTQGSSTGIIAFRYTDLSHATKNFSEQLGAGGFGSVFKGVLTDSTTIAVKRLDGARQGEKQFRAEVSSLGSIQHINLVKLIGFCCEGDHKRLLVYEHMVNGSLNAHLFDTSATIVNWSTRYQIAVGVARGLCYLHQSCHRCIIHCDIKPENILLDASFVPKIADFGMAAAVGRDFSRVLTTCRGTVGYLAPEWLAGVAVTPKVDVYSFGMVLLEIMSGRRNSSSREGSCNDSGNVQVEYFPVQAITKLQEGDVQSLMDPRLQGDFDLEEAERVCRVALWCIQDNELGRPAMAEVVRVLEGQQMVGMPPVPRLLAAIIESCDD